MDKLHLWYLYLLLLFLFFLNINWLGLIQTANHAVCKPFDQKRLLKKKIDCTLVHTWLNFSLLPVSCKIQIFANFLTLLLWHFRAFCNLLKSHPTVRESLVPAAMGDSLFMRRSWRKCQSWSRCGICQFFTPARFPIYLILPEKSKSSLPKKA